MSEEKKARTFDTCPDCKATLETTASGEWLHPHDCSRDPICAGCGVRGCSARALHEEVANAYRGMSQVEQLEVLRRHGIEPPNGHIDSGFMQAIVMALLRLEAALQGLPTDEEKTAAVESVSVREEFARRPAEPRPVIDYRPGTEPPRYKPNVRTRGRCGACEGKGRALFGFRRCGACEGKGYVK